MGIFKRAFAKIFSPKAMTSDELYRMIISTYGGGPTSSGISVNSDTAMRLMTVHNCVKVLSQSIAQLPLHLMEKSENIKKKADNHHLYPILHDQPNSWMTASEFWGMAIAHIALRGNFYAYKAQLLGRPIRQLIPFKTDVIQEVVQNPDYSLTYKAELNGVKKEFSGDEIMHLRGLTMNGFTGINPIQYARESIGLGLAGEQFLAKFYGKGMHPGAIVEHPLSLSAPAHKNLKTNLQEKYAGLGSAWDLMLLDEGMKVNFPEVKLVDAQFLELGKFNQSEICGMFRVPLMLVQAGDAPTTYASAEQFMLAFVTHALTPLVVNIEQAIRRDLLTEEEKGRYFAKFEMRGLLRGAFKEQMEGLQTAVNTEIMNPNEARDILDMNPYDGGEIYKTRTSTTKEQKESPDKGDK